MRDSRSGDNDLGIDEFLVEFGALALLVRCGDESVTLVLKPFSQTQLILGGAQKARLVASMLVALL